MRTIVMVDVGWTPWHDCDSDCLSAFQYSPYTRTLRVRFTDSGAEYEYEGVPMSVYETLVEMADDGGSVGAYFTSAIKPVYGARVEGTGGAFVRGKMVRSGKFERRRK